MRKRSAKALQTTAQHSRRGKRSKAASAAAAEQRRRERAASEAASKGSIAARALHSPSPFARCCSLLSSSSRAVDAAACSAQTDCLPPARVRVAYALSMRRAGEGAEGECGIRSSNSSREMRQRRLKRGEERSEIRLRKRHILEPGSCGCRCKLGEEVQCRGVISLGLSLLRAPLLRRGVICCFPLLKADLQQPRRAQRCR